MKIFTRFSAAVLLLCAVTLHSFGQINDVKFEPIKFQKIIDKMFVPSLESEIPGIVEGSIYNIVLCKRYFSALDYSAANAKLKWVIAESTSPSMSYKAHLALIYLSHSDRIDITPVSKADSYDYLFRQISDELKSKLLVTSGMIVQK